MPALHPIRRVTVLLVWNKDCANVDHNIQLDVLKRILIQEFKLLRVALAAPQTGLQRTMQHMTWSRREYIDRIY